MTAEAPLTQAAGHRRPAATAGAHGGSTAPRLARRSRFRFLAEFISEQAWRMALSRLARRHALEFYVLPGDLIGNITIASGLFERYEIHALQELARRFRHQNGRDAPGIFVDVGANIGAHSVALSPEFSQVIAIEPNPIVANILRANLAQNSRRNASVLEAALGDRDGAATLFSIEKWNAGMASLIPSEGAEQIATVQLRRGDDLFFDLTPSRSSVDLIKIDVEGHEPSVLRGLRQTLIRHKPLLALEVRGSSFAQEILRALEGTGYQHFYWLERPKRRAVMGRWGRLAELLTLGADIRLNPITDFEDTLYPMVIAATVPLEPGLRR